MALCSSDQMSWANKGNMDKKVEHIKIDVKIMSILTYTIVLFGNWSLSLNHGMLSILSPHPCPMLPVPIALRAGSLQMGQWRGVAEDHVTVVAWALLQDSFHTTLSLHHPPHTIATAVLYLSMHCCKLDVPGGRFTQKQWWEVFSPGTSEQTLQDIACKIMSVSD